MKNLNYEEQLFEKFLKTNINVDVPKEVESLLRKKLDEFREKMTHTEQYQYKEKTTFFYNIRSIFMNKKLVIGVAGAILIIFIGVYFQLWSKSPEKAYAAIAKKFEEAKTMTYKGLSKQELGQLGKFETLSEFLYKEPGYARYNISTKTEKLTSSGYGIIDIMKKKGIFIIDLKKQYIEMDLSGIPEEQSQINIIERMKTLPKRAESNLGKREIDGKILQGFLVKEEGMKKTVWLDASTGELVRIDMELLNIKGVQYTITDIKFNVPLDDTLFSFTPPEGYTPIKKDLYIPKDKPSKDDFINYLRFLSSYHKEKLFPSSINDFAEIFKHMKEFDKEKLKKEPEEKEQKEIQKAVQSGMQFVMLMKPENDWHYAGKGVKLGSANRPIFWWKPDGAKNYRVIYGDLKIRDVTPEELKKPEFNPR